MSTVKRHYSAFSKKETSHFSVFRFRSEHFYAETSSIFLFKSLALNALTNLLVRRRLKVGKNPNFNPSLVQKKIVPYLKEKGHSKKPMHLTTGMR